MNLPFNCVICTNKGLPCSLPLAADLVRGDFAFHHVPGMLFFEPNSMTSPLGANLNQRIGNTPLLRFERLTSGFCGRAGVGKSGVGQPGGSVKDRAASNILAEALRSGKLGAGKRLLDSTSGNTGITYAMLGAANGDSGYALHAFECIGRAEAHSSRLRSGDHLYRP